MGVLGWVFGGCFAIAALVMAALAGVAPMMQLVERNAGVQYSGSDVTACTAGFCHGVR